MNFYDRVKVVTASTGTSAITLGAAVPGYRSFAAAGVGNETVSYTIEDGVNWEVGLGTYSSNAATLTRTVTSSSNSNNPITLSGNALVFTTVRGADLLPMASVAEVRAGTGSGKIVDAATQAAAQAFVTLADASTILVDASTFINAQVTLGGNRTLGTPTNLYAGKQGLIRVVQDGTGSRTLSFSSAYKFSGGTPTTSVAAGAVDILSFVCVDASTPILNCIYYKAFA